MRSPFILWDRWSALLLVSILTHLALAPFTKVEESFNVQATHDLVSYGPHDLSGYDHLEFPGVVPRTFLGPLALAGATRAAAAAGDLLGAAAGTFGAGYPAPAPSDALGALALARAALGLASGLSMLRLRAALARATGSSLVGRLFLALVALSFHLPAYSSRPLPNVFALVLTNLGLAEWIISRAEGTEGSNEGGAGGAGSAGKASGRARGETAAPEAPSRAAPSAGRAIALLTAACAVFRCDCLLLLAPVGLSILAEGRHERRLPASRALATGAATAAACAAVSTLVDSYFWRRWVYPEAAVLTFNTVENRSAEWGVAPWHWYLTSALPRALQGSALLAPVGALACPPVRAPFLVASTYVFLYSFLPHKELRFLFPVLPPLFAAAAAGAARLLGQTWPSGAGEGGSRRRPARRPRGLARRTAGPLALAALLVPGLALTALTTSATSRNYPGGDALRLLVARRGDVEAAVLRAGASARGGSRDSPGEVGGARDGPDAGGRGDPSPLSPLPPQPAVRVHLCDLAATTGASRFGQLPAPWEYSKEEGLGPDALRARGFDVLVSEESFVDGYRLFAKVPAYAGLRREVLRPRAWLRAAARGGSEGPLTLLRSLLLERAALWVHVREGPEDPAPGAGSRGACAAEAETCEAAS